MKKIKSNKLGLNKQIVTNLMELKAGNAASRASFVPTCRPSQVITCQISCAYTCATNCVSNNSNCYCG